MYGNVELLFVDVKVLVKVIGILVNDVVMMVIDDVLYYYFVEY